MTQDGLRVAFFPDMFHEVDGVANTARQFDAFARRGQRPFLNVHAGPENRTFREGSVTTIELERRWPLVNFDKNHDFDVLLWRYYRQVEAAVRDFRADIVHITGPTDIGLMGALIAYRLQIPLAASWHTNVHEYAERRSLPFLAALPGGLAGTAGHLIRESSFQIVAQLYHGAQVLYAPNQELCDLLQRTTGKPCYLMQRGVDTHLFDPARRDRSGGPFTLGYIGRITPEKNVEMLIELEQGLLAAGVPEFRIAVVGQGHSEPLLRQSLRCGDFPGVLKGEPLARAFANLDLFIFPSETDTFGNVVLEALASGVPALVTDKGGPKFIVKHGHTGYVAASVPEFVQRAREVMTSPGLHQAMRKAAREHALDASWDHIFEGVYHGYDVALGRDSAAHAA